MTLRMVGLSLALTIVVSSALRSQVPPATPPPLALTNTTLVSAATNSLQRNQVILITGDRITAVFPSGSRTLPAGTQTIDLAGKYVIPGLIDTHIHVATDPSKEDTRVRTERRLKKALYGGVTAGRDMAGDVRALASLQRDALLGEIPSPDIYYVALFAGPRFFADPRTHDASRGLVAGEVPWMRAISDSTDLHQAIAEARGTGATAIKLYADLSGELARRITAEAHAQHLLVWAHAALRPATPIEVVNAGVDVISHANLVARALDSTRRANDMKAGPNDSLDLNDPGLDSVFTAILAHHTIFEPTLLVFQDAPALQRLGGAITRKAHERGITIVAGTDTLGGADDDKLTLPNLHAELELLVKLGGLTPAEALLSATRDAAVVLGAGQDRGTIEAGKLADLVVLSANPLTDIRNTRSVVMVLKRGKMYRRP